MHTQNIVTQVMQCCLPLMHAARWRALHDVVASSVNGCALSLVALAVGTPRTTTVRHRVKCVDRLLGNIHLEAHRFDLYAALARQWLTGLPQFLIVIDKSGYRKADIGSDTISSALDIIKGASPASTTLSCAHSSRPD